MSRDERAILEDLGIILAVCVILGVAIWAMLT